MGHHSMFLLMPMNKANLVVLVNGSVEVKTASSSLILKPSEMAKIDNGNIQRKQVNVMEYISWKNGYMELNKTPLADLLKKSEDTITWNSIMTPR